MKIKIEEISAGELKILFETLHEFGVKSYKVEGCDVTDVIAKCANLLTKGNSIVVYDGKSEHWDDPYGKLLSYWDTNREERGYFLSYRDMLANLNEAVNRDRYAKDLLFTWWVEADVSLDAGSADDLMQYILWGELIYG